MANAEKGDERKTLSLSRRLKTSKENRNIEEES